MDRKWLYGTIMIVSLLLWAGPMQAGDDPPIEAPAIYVPIVLGPQPQVETAVPTATDIILQPLPTATATATIHLIPLPTATPTMTQPAPTPSHTATPTPTRDIGNLCAADIFNCTDFATQVEAQAIYDHCMVIVGFDIHKLDRDGDGLACETLPMPLFFGD